MLSTRLRSWWVSWGGVGYLPRAPGTWGTLAAFPLIWFVHFLPLGLQIGLWLGFIFLSIFLIEKQEKVSGLHDASHIVVDEVAGFAVTLIGVPFGPFWLLGFVLFRV